MMGGVKQINKVNEKKVTLDITSHAQLEHEDKSQLVSLRLSLRICSC